MLLENMKRMQQKSDLKRYLKLEIVSEISRVREDKDISRKKLAKLSGVDKAVIADILSGRDLSTLSTLSKLCTALDISLSVDAIDKGKS